MKYIKKPVVIEAVQWTGDNIQEILDFADDVVQTTPSLLIETLEGTMRASIGDYIIKGVSGEFYPCKPDIFHKTYAPVDAQEDVVDVLPMPKWLQEVSDE